jgi:hypothetical protein
MSFGPRKLDCCWHQPMTAPKLDQLASVFNVGPEIEFACLHTRGKIQSFRRSKDGNSTGRSLSCDINLDVVVA